MIREALLFTCIYVPLAFVNLRVKLELTPVWFNGRLVSNHEKFLSLSAWVPENYRILQWGIPELISETFSVSVPEAYIVQRWLFVFLTFLAFHFYLRHWFSRLEAFAGVCFTAAILPLTYFDHLQESAPLLALSFVLLLWTIREKRDHLYAPILAIAAFNNETVLCVPALYFFVNTPRIAWEERGEVARVAGRTLLLAIPAFAVSIGIRAYVPDLPRLAPAYQLGHNFTGILSALQVNPLAHWNAPYTFVFWMYGGIWVLAATKWRRKPVFIRRSLLLVPIFLAFNLWFAMINEVRLLVPLAFILVPSAFFSLTEGDDPDGRARERGRGLPPPDARTTP